MSGNHFDSPDPVMFQGTEYEAEAACPDCHMMCDVEQETGFAFCEHHGEWQVEPIKPTTYTAEDFWPED